MEKRLIVAIAASLLVLLVFQKINPPKKTPTKGQMTFVPAETVNKQIERKEKSSEEAFKEQAQTELKEEKTVIETDTFYLSFSDIGGSLEKIILKEYQEKGQEQVLVDNSSSKEMIFAMKSPTIPGLTKRKFKQTKSDNFLAYTFEDPGKVKVIKKYEFYNSLDYIVLDVSTKNISSEHIYLSYQLNGPTNLKQVSQVAGRSFLEACTMENDKLWKVKSGKALQKKTGQISW
ncbi:MAG: membrane protein insertase YidC, partial [Candidatus Omnitrophica bacterium]|nr:membrane protein insertase YidC [Candidatus Omnitrophota bacterium]